MSSSAGNDLSAHDHGHPAPPDAGAPDPGRIPPARVPGGNRLLSREADGAYARRLAEEVGEWLLSLRSRMGHADPAALRDAGDRGAHELIVASLLANRPDDAVLSEEGADDLARLDADRVWIVDPLDGTREFGEEGRPDWAVHIGLWRRNTSAPFQMAAAAVGLPARGVILGTQPRPPAPPRWARSRPRLIASRTRMPDFLPAVAGELGADIVQLGSVGAKVGAVLSGEADAYVHAGGQHEWDSAAPVAIAVAAGLHASRIDGSELRYNQADTLLPDLLVCRSGMAPRLVAAIARHI